MSRISNRSPLAVPAPTPRVPAQTQAAASTAAQAGWSPSVGAAARVAGAPAASAAEVATAYFNAFQKQDTAAQGKLYAPDATFKDPIYDLKGRDPVVHMWTSLFKAGKDLTLSYKVLESNADGAKVSWTADYKVFGRPVHNEAVTDMKVKDGQIVSQQDSWSWSKWAKQALPLGPLVDFPPMKAALRFFLRQA